MPLNPNHPSIHRHRCSRLYAVWFNQSASYISDVTDVFLWQLPCSSRGTWHSSLAFSFVWWSLKILYNPETVLPCGVCIHLSILLSLLVSGSVNPLVLWYFLNTRTLVSVVTVFWLCWELHSVTVWMLIVENRVNSSYSHSVPSHSQCNSVCEEHIIDWYHQVCWVPVLLTCIVLARC